MSVQMKAIVKRAFDSKLVPIFFLPEKYKKKIIARRTFVSRRLKADARGFWAIDPMPTTEELNQFYEYTYWQARGKNESIHRRDLEHFVMLKQMIPEFFKTPKTILNFGAGHGGVSHLFYHLGHRVINIEPSGLELDYKDRNWTTYKTIDRLNESVDLVYGSHSIEHVQNIDEFMALIRSKLNPSGYLFFEVPNGKIAQNGGANGVICPPHTYYFTVDFFKALRFSPILCATFGADNFPSQPRKDEGGGVIRYLGQMLK